MKGRPKIGETRKMVTLPAELAQAIEDYRFANRLKTEAEAIRRLIEARLKAGDKIPIRKTSAEPSGGSDPAPGGADKPTRTRKALEPKARTLSKEAAQGVARAGRAVICQGQGHDRGYRRRARRTGPHLPGRNLPAPRRE